MNGEMTMTMIYNDDNDDDDNDDDDDDDDIPGDRGSPHLLSLLAAPPAGQILSRC